MTGDKLIYKYQSENAPEKKINYSYSIFGGEAFLEAWKNARNKAVTKSNTDYHLALKNNKPSPTETLFNCWIQAFEKNEPINNKAMNLLIKRFEVTKKIYRQYDENFRPLDKKEFDTYRLYLLFGYVLVIAFRNNPKLQYLNALLKVNDISTGLLNHLNEGEKALIAINLKSEVEFVETLRRELHE